MCENEEGPCVHVILYFQFACKPIKQGKSSESVDGFSGQVRRQIVQRSKRPNRKPSWSPHTAPCAKVHDAFPPFPQTKKDGRQLQSQSMKGTRAASRGYQSGQRDKALI